ncbi:MAG: hypothetical protein WAZ18_06020, partial [Alphaproteobacteria bacterium]
MLFAPRLRHTINLLLVASLVLSTTACTQAYYNDEVKAPTEQALQDAREFMKPQSALREGVFHMQRIQQGSTVRVKDEIKLKKPDLPAFDVAYIGRDVESVVLELANAAGESVVIPQGLRGRTVTLVHSGANFEQMLDLVLSKAGYHYNYVNGVWYITRYPVRNYVLEIGQSNRKGSLSSKVELSPELAAGSSSGGGGSELDTDYSDQFWTEVKDALTDLVKIGDSTPNNNQLQATGVTASGQIVTDANAGQVSQTIGLLPPPEKEGVVPAQDEKLFAAVTGTATDTLKVEAPKSDDHQG